MQVGGPSGYQTAEPRSKTAGPGGSKAKEGPPRCGGGPGDPKAKEAPALMRRGPLWLQSDGGPHPDTAGAPAVAKRMRPPAATGAPVVPLHTPAAPPTGRPYPQHSQPQTGGIRVYPGGGGWGYTYITLPPGVPVPQLGPHQTGGDSGVSAAAWGARTATPAVPSHRASLSPARSAPDWGPPARRANLTPKNKGKGKPQGKRQQARGLPEAVTQKNRENITKTNQKKSRPQRRPTPGVPALTHAFSAPRIPVLVPRRRCSPTLGAATSMTATTPAETSCGGPCCPALLHGAGPISPLANTRGAVPHRGGVTTPLGAHKDWQSGLKTGGPHHGSRDKQAVGSGARPQSCGPPPLEPFK